MILIRVFQNPKHVVRVSNWKGEIYITNKNIALAIFKNCMKAM